jgi:hypothetical protein
LGAPWARLVAILNAGFDTKNLDTKSLDTKGLDTKGFAGCRQGLPMTPSAP